MNLTQTPMGQLGGVNWGEMVASSQLAGGLDPLPEGGGPLASRKARDGGMGDSGGLKGELGKMGSAGALGRTTGVEADVQDLVCVPTEGADAHRRGAMPPRGVRCFAPREKNIPCLVRK